MLGVMRTVAGAVLAVVMGLSFAVAQNVPAASSAAQVEPAKYEVEVDVVDQQGAMIPNANVSLTGPGDKGELKSVITGPTGRAHFPNQLTGKYTAQVSARGFQDAKESVGLPSKGEVRVTLSVGPPEIIFDPTAPSVETITSSLGNQLPLPPAPPPATAPETAAAPRRNPLARFFSGIGHRLGRL
jgi:hypothetical protein